MATVESENLTGRLDLLAAWIEAQIAYRNIPGLSIAIVYDQELVWAKGFGLADVENGVPATAGTLYRIASVTKLFTATAVLQLRDAGKLQLDDPLVKHLPWFQIQEQFLDAPPVTLRHLLTHTAGLPRESPYPYWVDFDAFPSREQLQAALAGQSTPLPPEQRWKYSNLALTLAGEAVAAVSGQPYADYLQSQILDPLQMAATRVATPPPGTPGLAIGYGRRLPDGRRSRRPHIDTAGITPAANIITSVNDLARFAMLHFRDEKPADSPVLRGSTAREMQRVHWLEPDWQAGWGLGFRVQRVGEKNYASHGGSLPGFRAQFRLCPADKVAVIALANANDGNPLLFVEKAFEWVAPALVAARAPRPQAAGPDPVWQQYVGRYQDYEDYFEIMVLDGRLALVSPLMDDPLESASYLVPTGQHTFRIESDDGYDSVGEAAVFEMGDEGRAVRLYWGPNYFDRVVG